MASDAPSDVEKHVISNIRCVRLASNTHKNSLWIGPKNIMHYDVTKFPRFFVRPNVISIIGWVVDLSMFFHSQAFGDAYNLVQPTLKAGEVLDPYVIRNESGEDLILKLDNDFEVGLRSLHH